MMTMCGSPVSVEFVAQLLLQADAEEAGGIVGDRLIDHEGEQVGGRS